MVRRPPKVPYIAKPLINLAPSTGRSIKVDRPNQAVIRRTLRGNDDRSVDWPRAGVLSGILYSSPAAVQGMHDDSPQEMQQ